MIDFGTIGNKPCELVLNKLLIANNNQKLTNIVMSRIMAVKETIQKLKSYLSFDKGFYACQLNINRRISIESINLLQNSIPKDVFSYLKNVIITEYKLALKDIILQNRKN